MLYVPFGGHFGDCSDYHGWVVGVSFQRAAESGGMVDACTRRRYLSLRVASATRGSSPQEILSAFRRGDEATCEPGTHSTGKVELGHRLAAKFFPPPCHTAPGGLVFKVMEVSKRGLRGMRPGFGFAFKGLIVFAIA
jgi:hypothetical protein